MKKALLVCDGKHFPAGAFKLAKNLREHSPLLLTGVFLSAAQFASLWFYPVEGRVDFLTARIEEDGKAIAKNIELFSRLCDDYGIEHKIHAHSEDLIFDAVKQESRFADFIVMSGELFYTNIEAAQPNSYTKTVLHEAECPVMLVPEHVKIPENIILTYDGSESSVFAIKQFTYLFPEWCNLDTLLVFANNEGKPIPNQEYMEELARRHFPKVSFLKLEAVPAKHIAAWAEDKRSSLLVSGSFGRSGLSNLIKKSFVTEVISNHELPVFITHK